MRVFCAIHGTIELGDCAAHVAQSPAFYRLDGVRQLGGCSYVYPSATHTRREHSLGVAHLSRKAGVCLQRLYPDLVSATDVARLELAGLVHDLGHGPFSHTFEACFATFSHEQEGVRLLHALALDRTFSDVAARCLGDGWLDAVRNMVLGLAPDPSRAFLFQIVHAHHSGIDTDKLDYLERDCHAVMGTTNMLSVDRIVEGMRIVVSEDGARTLGFDERVEAEVCNVYRIRTMMHRQVYQHRSVLLVESLLVSMLHRVDAARTDAGQLSLCRQLAQGVDGLVDGSLLLHPGARAHEVMAWKQWQRLPTTLRVRTLPSCAHCGHETQIPDRHCAQCGHDLCNRAFISDAVGVRNVVGANVTSGDATRAVQARCDVAVCVVVSDIRGGAHLLRYDAWGRPWNDWGWEPIPIVSEAAPHGCLTSPAHMRWREAVCYAPPGTAPADVARAQTAFETWGAPALPNRPPKK